MSPSRARAGLKGTLLLLLLSAAVRADDGPGPIHTVLIDAVAVDARGRAVSTLKATDFELRQDGVVQTIDRAEFRRADRPRLFAVFLDEYHISPDAATDALRAGLRRFVDALDAGDELVVMKPLDSLFGITLSTDRDVALAAIAGLEGRRGVYQPRNAYERNFIAGTPARIEAARDQVALSAMNALAVHLGSLGDARKTLIVVTERVGPADRRRGLEHLPTLDTIIRSANRANVAIYVVDPRGGSEPDAGSGRLATGTDGAVVASDLDAGLQRASADASGYYLLTYRAAHREDGAVHEIRVTTPRAGVRLHARAEYWAPSPDDLLRAAVLDRINHPKPAKPPEPMRHISPLIRPWLGLSRGEAGKTRVTLVWEPAARVPGDRSRRTPIRVVVKALAPDDSILFDGPLRPTGAGALEADTGVPSRAVFDAPPGPLRLRMSIEDAAAQPLDSDVRDVSIPDFGRPVVIGTPEIFRARNLREFRTLAAGDAVPVASREFSRTERLLIRFPAYAPGDELPALSATLLSRNGQPIRDLVVTPAKIPGGANEIDLTLAAFAAGDYLVELTAKTPAGDARDRIGFRVTW